MDPILIDVPQEIFTDRLRLRVPRVADGPTIAPAVRASLAELRPWMPWATEPYTDDDSATWARRSASQFILREQIQYCIYDRRDGDHLGNLGAHRIDWKTRNCEVGYWLRTDRVGRGLMSEAVNAVVDVLATAGLKRIEIRCDPRNDRSAAVARRCGFELDGVLRGDTIDPAGLRQSTMVFSRLIGDSTDAPAACVRVQSG